MQKVRSFSERGGVSEKVYTHVHCDNKMRGEGLGRSHCEARERAVGDFRRKKVERR